MQIRLPPNRINKKAKGKLPCRSLTITIFHFFGPYFFIIGRLEKRIQGEEIPELSIVSCKPRPRKTRDISNRSLDAISYP